MKKISILIAFLFATLLSANNGEEIFKAKCSACHLIQPPEAMMNPGTPEFEKAVNALKAPPMAKVASMIKMKHEGKVAFVKFMNDYITNPDASKSVCMKRAIKGFGLMPAIGKSMSEADKTAVAEWIYVTAKDTKKTKDMKCGEGKCGGEKKCGSDMKKEKKAMKCESGKCGGDTKIPAEDKGEEETCG